MAGPSCAFQNGIGIRYVHLVIPACKRLVFLENAEGQMLSPLPGLSVAGIRKRKAFRE